MKTAMAETTMLTIKSIAINSITCFEKRDTKEKLRLNCGVTTELCRSALRVPSAMIGQYTLKPDTHSNRDTRNEAHIGCHSPRLHQLGLHVIPLYRFRVV